MFLKFFTETEFFSNEFSNIQNTVYTRVKLSTQPQIEAT